MLAILSLPLVWAALTLPIPGSAAVGGAADVSFIAFGDAGSGSDGQLALRDQMVAHGASYDFAVMLGDNAYPTGSYANFTSKVFGVYGSLFEGQNQALPAPTDGLPKPAFPTPGNHEYEGDKTAAGYTDSFVLPTNGPVGVPPERYYTYDVGAVHFISFDSEYVAGSGIATSQAHKDAIRSWLIADLDAHVSHVTVVYDHHPAYTAGPHHGETEEAAMRSTWFPVFAAHGADLVLSGHDHSYQRNTPQSGLTSYVVGTGGGDLEPVSPQPYTAASLSDYAYLAIDVRGCSISTRVVRSNGSLFDPWTFTAPTCDAGPGSGQLFADGFETGDFSAWSSVQVGPGGTATVQSSNVRSGAFAVNLTAAAAAGSFAYARKQLPAAQLDLVTTADVKVVGDGAPGGNVPLLRLYSETGERVLSFYRQNEAGSRLYVQHSGLFNTTTGVLPLGTWGTIQVRVRVNGPSSVVEARLNGTLIYQASSANLGGSGILRIQIGNDTPGQAFSLVADNVSASDAASPNPTPTASVPSLTSPTGTTEPSPSSVPSGGPGTSQGPTPTPTTLIDEGFEDGSLRAWTVRTGPGGAAFVQSAIARTGGWAARLSATNVTGSYADMRRSFLPTTTLTATLDLWMAAEGAAGGNVPLIRFYDAARNRVLTVFRQNANGGRLFVSFGGVTYQTAQTLPLGTWTALSVHVVVAGRASTVEVMIDGSPILSTTSANLGSAALTAIQIGNDTKRQTFDQFIDNVLVQDP